MRFDKDCLNSLSSNSDAPIPLEQSLSIRATSRLADSYISLFSSAPRIRELGQHMPPSHWIVHVMKNTSALYDIELLRLLV